jgi:endonuclease III
MHALLDTYGMTYAQEIGIDLDKNNSSELFKLLTATLLFSIRISSTTAVKAARALFERGWTTPEKMLASTWEERVAVLDKAKYARYDESTASKLADMAHLIIDRYHGDLRNLRESASRNPGRERELLMEFKGIGEIGANIFCREIQGIWKELYPFIDPRAASAAKKLHLLSQADRLAAVVPKKCFPNLAAALIRIDLNDKYNEAQELIHNKQNVSPK